MVTTLADDPLLAHVPEVRGYKFLEPCLLYGFLGRGGMGSVYLGQHLRLNIPVAIKCMSVQLDDTADQRIYRFQREARLAASVSHQNLVRVYDVLRFGRLHYMVMEYVDGENARERVARKGRLALSEALTIVYRAGMGLEAAHEAGIIHRDIKPDNILISATGEVKLADLGLAKAVAVGGGKSFATTGVQVLGTPKYMPPEQWEDTGSVGPQADVYALGATLYFLLAGEDGFSGSKVRGILQQVMTKPFPDVREKVPSVPAEVAKCIAVSTAKEPGARFADASEFLKAIHSFDADVALEDPETGQVRETVTMISPPPFKTLLLARRAVTVRGPLTGAEEGDGSARPQSGRSTKTAPLSASAETPALPTLALGKKVAAGLAFALLLGAGGVLASKVLGGSGDDASDAHSATNADGAEVSGGGGLDATSGEGGARPRAPSALELQLELRSFDKLVADYHLDDAELVLARMREADPEATLELEATLEVARGALLEARTLAQTLRAGDRPELMEEALARADVLCLQDPPLCARTELADAREAGNGHLEVWQRSREELGGLESDLRELDSIGAARRLLPQLEAAKGRASTAGLQGQLDRLHGEIVAFVVESAELQESELQTAADAIDALVELDFFWMDLKDEEERDQIGASAERFFARLEAEITEVTSIAHVEPLLAGFGHYFARCPDAAFGERAAILCATLEAQLQGDARGAESVSDAIEVLSGLDRCLEQLPPGELKQRILEVAEQPRARVAEAAGKASTQEEARRVLAELGDALIDRPNTEVGRGVAEIRAGLFSIVSAEFENEPSINGAKTLSAELAQWGAELPPGLLADEVERRRGELVSHVTQEIEALIARGEKALQEEDFKTAEKHFKEAQRKARGFSVKILATVRLGDRMLAVAKTHASKGVASRMANEQHKARNLYLEALKMEGDYKDSEGVSAKAHATYYVAELYLIDAKFSKDAYEDGLRRKVQSTYYNKNNMEESLRYAAAPIRALKTTYAGETTAEGCTFLSKIQARKTELGL